MASHQDETPAIRAGARMIYTATDSIRSGRFLWPRLAEILALSEKVKSQYRAVERVTGIPPRRQKDIRGGYLRLVHDYEAERLRQALAIERARAKQLWAETECDTADVERWLLESRAVDRVADRAAGKDDSEAGG